MKTEIIKKVNTKKFDPFEMRITVESLEEAKVIWNVFNWSRKIPSESFDKIDDVLMEMGYDDKTLDMDGSTELHEL